MSKAESLCLVVYVGLFILSGCAQTQQREQLEYIYVPDIGKAQAMQIAEDVLGQMHFTIDKADVEQGFIRTKPLPGAQFFEFWRSDNVDASNSLQANLHTIRRTVELGIGLQGERGSKNLCIACDVKVHRLSLPEHEVSSSARAYEMFSRSNAAMQKLRLHREQKKQMAWLELGNDTQLATLILKRVEEQIAAISPPPARRTSDESRATRDEK